jgi:hypothetical protein
MTIFARLLYQLQSSALTLSYFNLQFRIICLLLGNRCQLFWVWWKLVIPCHSDRTGKILKCGVCHQSINWCSVGLVTGWSNSCTKLRQAHQNTFKSKFTSICPRNLMHRNAFTQLCRQHEATQLCNRSENWTLWEMQSSWIRCRYTRREMSSLLPFRIIIFLSSCFLCILFDFRLPPLLK